ncbi:fungal Zn binuclear cluster domain-containing protein [Pochonia chlamydosporia 170]|uniref:Fungal Zn binuclear cluster domain-containing protein n=1 Tax=Pochonia chlamydosporia 170 TaxID=1380566 RepID=A0A179G3U3_METCM|nr:fungal Zn binuclear cluster domain-containing protein [Pochonia chlamydosporia 170]OAQ72526.1 fungal Zn binuclear cluster domain-containing protein [Pochonia chlamydosporia 170]
MAHHLTEPSADQPLQPRKESYKTKMGSPERPKSPNALLKRSFSTPDTAQLQKQASDDSQHSSTGEKKRNKLGYHRTSIACSHCRRRKIRCIASPDVPNRCVNCIRLKKECSFYPVDQQPGTDTRPKAPSRQTGGPTASSASSSPAVGTGSPAGTPSAVMGSGINMTGSHGPNTDYFSSDASVSPNGIPASNQYTFSNQPTSGWVPTGSTNVSKPEDMAPVPWHAYPTESPMSGQFSPYTQTSTASVTWTSGTSEAGSHDEMAWGEFPTPMRSLSYSGESTGSHPQASFMPIAQPQPYERRQSNFSDVYPPFPTNMAGGNPIASNPPQMVTGAPFASGVNPWQSQQLLATQGSAADWQYGTTDGTQAMIMEDQRAAPGVTQAPSGIYYST